MRIFLILLIFFTHSVFSEEFKIREKRYYGGERLELQSVASNGASIQKILELTTPNSDELPIRILAPLEYTAGNEVLDFFNKHYPNELSVALESSGNIHNPALKGLKLNFINAYKSSSVFNEFTSALAAHGYKVKQIEYEKLSVFSGQVYVAEITIHCIKGT